MSVVARCVTDSCFSPLYWISILDPSPARTTARRWPKWLPIVGWTLLGVLATTLLVFIATMTFGAVHGTEFCPQTFERRSYSYYELPIIRVQVTGERHEDLTGDTEACVTSNNFIPPAAGGKQDWHVLVGSRGTRLRRPGDAGILVQYLDATESDNAHRWVQWSNKNKPLAQLLWPAVQRLAVHDLYLYVPDLFDLAKTVDDAVKLKQELNHLVAEKLLLLARRHSDHEDHAGTIEILDEALALEPENAELKAARATASAAKSEVESPTSKVEK
jgi:hypothetical protein